MQISRSYFQFSCDYMMFLYLYKTMRNCVKHVWVPFHSKNHFCNLQFKFCCICTGQHIEDSAFASLNTFSPELFVVLLFLASQLLSTRTKNPIILIFFPRSQVLGTVLAFMFGDKVSLCSPSWPGTHGILLLQYAIINLIQRYYQTIHT